jgi:hypothetical protein
MERIRTTFSKLFDGKQPKVGVNRTCKEYKEFAKAYGLYHSIQSACDYDITKVRKVFKEYLTTFFEYLTYMSDKAIADDFQHKFEEKMRKSKMK